MTNWLATTFLMAAMTMPAYGLTYNFGNGSSIAQDDGAPVPTTIIKTPVILVEALTDNFTVFDATINVPGSAAAIAFKFEAPSTGDTGIALKVIGAIDADTPATGPSLTFNFGFPIGDVHYAGNFIGYGDVNSISDIQNVAFTDITLPPGPAVPEASTWAMLAIGFTALGWMAHREAGRALK